MSSLRSLTAGEGIGEMGFRLPLDLLDKHYQFPPEPHPYSAHLGSACRISLSSHSAGSESATSSGRSGPSSALIFRGHTWQGGQNFWSPSFSPHRLRASLTVSHEPLPRRGLRSFRWHLALEASQISALSPHPTSSVLSCSGRNGSAFPP